MPEKMRFYRPPVDLQLAHHFVGADTPAKLSLLDECLLFADHEPCKGDIIGITAAESHIWFVKYIRKMLRRINEHRGFFLCLLANGRTNFLCLAARWFLF